MQRNSELVDKERGQQVCVPIPPTSDSVKWENIYFLCSEYKKSE